MDLSTVGRRDKLTPQREPYWQRLSKGCFLGYRPSASGIGGTWIARFYNSDEQKKHLKALGDFGNLPPNERHAVAKRDAEAWFQHLGRGGSRDLITVKDACDAFAETRPDAVGRFRRLVNDDPIANVKLLKLNKTHVQDWRKRLESKPAMVSRSKSGEKRHRTRAAGSINRDMATLRAALNAARKAGAVIADIAWREPLEQIKGAGRRRNLYLDRAQRSALLEKLPTDIRAFVNGLCVLPLRPGALASLLVEHFDSRRKELTIGKDKAGADRKLLLPSHTAALLKQQCNSKLPRAPLFCRADGAPWNKETWKGPINDAVIAARLPVGTTAYTLRHSAITDLVSAGLDLITVARLSGTSVAMIELHYAHLQQHRAADALAGLVL